MLNSNIEFILRNLKIKSSSKHTQWISGNPCPRVSWRCGKFALFLNHFSKKGDRAGSDWGVVITN
jgi:hypothetical protein